MPDANYTQREHEEFRADMKDHLGRQDAMLSSIKSIVENTRVEASNDRSRINHLDEWSAETKLLIENLIGETTKLKTDKTRIYTIISVVMVVGGALGFMYYNLVDLKIETESAQIKAENDKFRTSLQSKIDDQTSKIPQAISDGIESYFSSHFSKAEIINNQ